MKVEKLASASGVGSILGSWQVCHNMCLGLISLLGIIGITVSGMPLLFMTKFALPLWILAVILFVVTIAVFIRKNCITLNPLLLNAGLIVMGTPFFSSWILYATGGALVGTASIRYITQKVRT